MSRVVDEQLAGLLEHRLRRTEGERAWSESAGYINDRSSAPLDIQGWTAAQEVAVTWEERITSARSSKRPEVVGLAAAASSPAVGSEPVMNFSMASPSGTPASSRASSASAHQTPRLASSPQASPSSLLPSEGGAASALFPGSVGRSDASAAPSPNADSGVEAEAFHEWQFELLNNLPREKAIELASLLESSEQSRLQASSEAARLVKEVRDMEKACREAEERAMAGEEAAAAEDGAQPAGEAHLDRAASAASAAELIALRRKSAEYEKEASTAAAARAAAEAELLELRRQHSGGRGGRGARGHHEQGLSSQESSAADDPSSNSKKRGGRRRCCCCCFLLKCAIVALLLLLALATASRRASGLREMLILPPWAEDLAALLRKLRVPAHQHQQEEVPSPRNVLSSTGTTSASSSVAHELRAEEAEAPPSSPRAEARSSVDAVRDGDSVHLQNLYGSPRVEGTFLDARAAGCEHNALCVSAAYSRSRDGTSGTWFIERKLGAGILQHGDRVSIKHVNDRAGGKTATSTYLDARGGGCEGNSFCVSTATSSTRDGLTGTWSIERKLGAGPVRYGEAVYIRNLYARTSYLDSRQALCEGNALCISLASSASRDGLSGTWLMVAAGSRETDESSAAHLGSLPQTAPDAKAFPKTEEDEASSAEFVKTADSVAVIAATSGGTGTVRETTVREMTVRQTTTTEYDKEEYSRVMQENAQMKAYFKRLMTDVDVAMKGGQDMVCWPLGDER